MSTTLVRTRRSRHMAAVGVTLAALALAGCAGPDDETAETPTTSDPSVSETPASEPPAATDTTTPSESTTPSEPAAPATPTAPAGLTLGIRINGDEVQPNAIDLDLAVGDPLTITFDTDRGGELHVHSKPEQYVEFEAGSSTKELVIETPGTVEIEEHDTEAVVAVVQVR